MLMLDLVILILCVLSSIHMSCKLLKSCKQFLNSEFLACTVGHNGGWEKVTPTPVDTSQVTAEQYFHWSGDRNTQRIHHSDWHSCRDNTTVNESIYNKCNQSVYYFIWEEEGEIWGYQHVSLQCVMGTDSPVFCGFTRKLVQVPQWPMSSSKWSEAWEEWQVQD